MSNGLMPRSLAFWASSMALKIHLSQVGVASILQKQRGSFGGFRHVQGIGTCSSEIPSFSLALDAKINQFDSASMPRKRSSLALDLAMSTILTLVLLEFGPRQWHREWISVKLRLLGIMEVIHAVR